MKTLFEKMRENRQRRFLSKVDKWWDNAREESERLTQQHRANDLAFERMLAENAALAEHEAVQNTLDKLNILIYARGA